MWLTVHFYLVMHAAKEAQTNYHYILYPWFLCPMCPFLCTSLPLSPSFLLLYVSGRGSIDCGSGVTVINFDSSPCRLALSWEERVMRPIHGASKVQPSFMHGCPTSSQSNYTAECILWYHPTWAVSRWLLHSTDIQVLRLMTSDIHYFDFMDIQR